MRDEIVLDDQCPITGRRCDRPCGAECIRGMFRPAVARPDQGDDDGERPGPDTGPGTLAARLADWREEQAHVAAHPLAGVLQDVAAPIVERDALREAIRDELPKHRDLITAAGDNGFRVGCACGWSGPTYTLNDLSEPAVAKAWQNHRADALLDGPLAAVLAQAAADRAAVERVEALAESWRYKGEFGWGAWQEGDGPDEHGQMLDECASDLRAALRSGGGR